MGGLILLVVSCGQQATGPQDPKATCGTLCRLYVKGCYGYSPIELSSVAACEQRCGQWNEAKLLCKVHLTLYIEDNPPLFCAGFDNPQHPCP